MRPCKQVGLRDQPKVVLTTQADDWKSLVKRCIEGCINWHKPFASAIYYVKCYQWKCHFICKAMHLRYQLKKWFLHLHSSSLAEQALREHDCPFTEWSEWDCTPFRNSKNKSSVAHICIEIPVCIHYVLLFTLDAILTDIVNLCGHKRYLLSIEIHSNIVNLNSVNSNSRIIWAGSRVPLKPHNFNWRKTLWIRTAAAAPHLLWTCFRKKYPFHYCPLLPCKKHAGKQSTSTRQSFFSDRQFTEAACLRISLEVDMDAASIKDTEDR